MSELSTAYENAAEFPVSEPPPIPAKKAAARGYNRSAGALLIQYAIAIFVQIIIMTIMLCFNVDTDASFPNLLMVAVSYAAANPLAYAIGLSFTGRLKGSKKLFSKPDLNSGTMLWALPATLGLQSISMLLQIIFQVVTGSSGTENMDMDMFSFGGDMAVNILLFIYSVVIAPIGEELLMRGMVLRNTTCAGRTAAIIFTSVVFGLFHGNILQFILGFFTGLLFAYIDIKAGSLLPSILLHVFNNLMAYALEAAGYFMTTEEQVGILNIAYLAVTFIAGVFGMIFLRRRLKNKETPDDSPYAPVYEVTAEERKKCGIIAMLKSPCVWIFTAIYTISIIGNIFA